MSELPCDNERDPSSLSFLSVALIEIDFVGITFVVVYSNGQHVYACLAQLNRLSKQMFKWISKVRQFSSVNVLEVLPNLYFN